MAQQQQQMAQQQQQQLSLMQSPRHSPRWVPGNPSVLYQPARLMHSMKNMSPSPRERAGAKDA
jgi:hypothetical protein